MKSRTNIKTRLLALVLTVLMTVGVLPFSVFALNGEATTDRLQTDNTLYKAPTGEEIKEALGSDGELLYYNDYNSITTSSPSVEQINAAATKSGGATLNSGSDRTLVDDGFGGKAVLFAQAASNQKLDHKIQLGARKANPANQGKNFVYASDYKLGDKVTAGQFIVFNCFTVNSDSYKSMVAIPLWIDADGALYVSKVDWNTATASGTKGGVVTYVNEAKMDVMKGEQIAQLSRDEFTNVAVQVKDNQFRVFINGADKTGWLLFMSDSARAIMNKDGANYDLTKGFAFGAVSIYREKAGDGYVHDNTTLYFADEFVSSGGKEYDSALTSKDLSGNVASFYESDSAYWKKISLTETDKRASSLSGDVYTMTGAGKDSQVCLVVSNNWKDNIFKANLSGLDIALNIDVTVSANSQTGVGGISAWLPFGVASGCWQYNMVNISVNKETNTHYFCMPKKNASYGAGDKIHDIELGSKYSVRILIDADDTARNTYFVYIGKYEGDTVKRYTYCGSTDIVTNTTAYGQNRFKHLDAQANWSAESGYEGKQTGLMFNGIRVTANKTISLSMAAECYYYDDDADGDVTNSVRQKNVIGATLLHYNDFNDQPIGKASATYTGTMSALSASIRSGAGEAIIDDGRGGKAFTYKKSDTIPSGFQAYYQVKGLGSAGAGKSFVISTDIKLVRGAEGSIFGATAYEANAEGYGRDFNTGIIYTKPDGGIYVAHKTEGNESGVYVNEYSGLWKNTATKIGYLNTSEFTNVAVAVNVEANTYKVYINGVDATGDMQFLLSSDKAKLEATTAYANGFGLSYSRINLIGGDSTTIDAPIILDNIAAYLYGEFVKPNNSPLNGYIYDSGKYYYYDNANIASNFTSADGILRAGLDGVVKNGETPVSTMNSIYRYVGNDIVPIDGIFTGVYGYVKSDKYYCYDASKNLIRNKTIYDAISEGIEAAGYTGASGFSIDGNGVATGLNGYIRIEADDKSYFYVNGIKTIGFVEIGGNVFYIKEDYTFYAGYQTVEGKVYFFDGDNDNKGALVNGVHTPDLVTTKYYVNGVAQVGGIIDAGTTKYYADANGLLLTGIQIDTVTGNKYFFLSDGANKYQMAVNTSVVSNGSIITIGEDGIIDEIGGKVYGQWSNIDGKYYYSDASGNVATGFVYIETDPSGAEGGYYYFDNNGDMVKEAFKDVYGTTMYFHTDGKAPTGVVFVSQTAIDGMPVRARAAGEYMHFFNGVLTTGTTEAILEGYKYTFNDGRFVSRVELNAANPEILVTVKKDNRVNNFCFNSEDDGELDMLLANYPCYTLAVYDVTDPLNPVEITADGTTGAYTFIGEHSYEIEYTALEHVLGTTPVDKIPATCGSDGYKIYQCTNTGCVAIHMEKITQRPDHVFNNNVTEIIAPTCVDKGVGVTWCANGCGASKTVDIAPTNVHNYTILVDMDPSTCSRGGWKITKCATCDDIKHEALPLAEHSFVTYIETTPATCVKGGIKTATCENCTATDTILTAPDYDKHVGGAVAIYDEAAKEHYELFQTTTPSTCFANGTGTLRCKHCGGFVTAGLVIDASSHHYDPADEYLVVLDSEGNIIETIKIVNGEVLRDGNKVADEDPTIDDRAELLSYSLKICGDEGEWRIDCKKGCVNSETGKVFCKVVGPVEETFRHQFDTTKLYTTSDVNDPLYGNHYYKCLSCGKAAGITPHEMTTEENPDGTHNHVCICEDEATNTKYGEFNVNCASGTKYDADNHWTEFDCGLKKNVTAHTMGGDYSKDEDQHWQTCSCGYENKTDHAWTDVDAKAPSCYEEGYTAHQVCACGAKKNYQTLGLEAHTFKKTYDSDDTYHWYACEVCSYEYRKQNHTFVNVPALDPTCVDDGYTAHKICAECGHTVGKTTIDNLDHDTTGQPYSFDNKEHWQLCNRCNTLIYGTHTLGALLSEEEGTKQCADCQHIVIDLNLTWWYPLGFTRETDGSRYVYKYNDVVNKLVTINGNYYFFDANGYLVLTGDAGVDNANVKAPNGTFDTITNVGNHGIITDAVITTVDGIFYISGGVMQTGWETLDGKDYYFNSKLSGELVVADALEGALIKGQPTIMALNTTETAKILVNIDENGARLLGVIMDGADAYYYLDGTAGKLTGRIEDNYYNVGNIYFAGADGKLLSGAWQVYNGVYYSFNPDYSMAVWHSNDTTTLPGDTLPIYTDGEGKKIITGWFGIVGAGGKYIENGIMVVESTEFDYKQIGEYYYAFNATGNARYYTGWNDEGTLYIFNGSICKNRFEYIVEDNMTCYFDADGQVVKAESGKTLLLSINSYVYSISDIGAVAPYAVNETNPAWVCFLVNGKVDVNAKGYYTHTGFITSQAITIGGATYVFDANGRLVVSQDNYECNGSFYIIDAEGKATLKPEEEEE